MSASSRLQRPRAGRTSQAPPVRGELIALRLRELAYDAASLRVAGARAVEHPERHIYFAHVPLMSDPAPQRDPARAAEPLSASNGSPPGHAAAAQGGEQTRGARRLGVAIQGLGGAVATTAAAGLALLRRGLIDTTGLPLARLERQQPELFAQLDLAGYDQITFGGWDPYDADLLTAARGHGVLAPEQLDAVADDLAALRPWPALTSDRFLRAGHLDAHAKANTTHRESIDRIRQDLARFREQQRLDAVVMLNLSSTEAAPPWSNCFDRLDALERALNADEACISPSLLYAYAALVSGVPHVNFTPTRATDWPAMIELAEREGVPVCGKDGKTGQTLLKTVLAPAFRDRHLLVEGWFSTNLLGNRDGQVLADPQSLASKIATKTDVLDAILGYPVGEHQVHIHYYKPRGDAKEAWDNIDLVGFAGRRMQVKLNFLCRDSILAAPLSIDLCRLADLAQLRAERGVVEALGVFFKSPTMRSPALPEHDFFKQQAAFLGWLKHGTPHRAPAEHRHSPLRHY